MEHACEDALRGPQSAHADGSCKGGVLGVGVELVYIAEIQSKR